MSLGQQAFFYAVCAEAEINIAYAGGPPFYDPDGLFLKPQIKPPRYNIQFNEEIEEASWTNNIATIKSAGPNEDKRLRRFIDWQKVYTFCRISNIRKNSNDFVQKVHKDPVHCNFSFKRWIPRLNLAGYLKV